MSPQFEQGGAPGGVPIGVGPPGGALPPIPPQPTRPPAPPTGTIAAGLSTVTILDSPAK